MARAWLGGRRRLLRRARGRCGGRRHQRDPATAPTLGYWNDPELTARVFRTDAQGRRAVFSGDLVRRDEEGFLYF
ncbi:MAG: hypothetical protein DMD33_20640, partial [Gemmatimonadetes bacterium]